MSDAPGGPGWWQASDGKYYPPQTGAPPPGAPPVPKKGMPGCLKWGLIGAGVAILLGAGCVALIGGAADEAAEDLEEEEADSFDDASISACEVDPTLKWMKATVSVTNDSSERSNYLVDVVFEGPDGNQIDSSAAIINSVEPDQTAQGDATTATEPSGDFECRISEVERLSDDP